MRFRRHNLAFYACILLLVVFLIFTLFPLAWLLLTSIKPDSEIFRWPPQILSGTFTLESYVNIFKNTNILMFVFNSLVVSLGATILSVAVGAAAAYGFTRYFARGESVFLLVLLFTRMLPDTLLIVPVFKIASWVGLINSYTGLILAYSTVSLPFAIWMLIGFMRSIPKELDEAATVDGANPFQVFYKIILPPSAAGIFAVGLCTFLLAWNSYVWPLILTTREEYFVLPLAIVNMAGQLRVGWGEVMAATVIAAGPVLIIFSVLERYLLR
jgi:multiple sugar transport system permease protein